MVNIDDSYQELPSTAAEAKVGTGS
jgi:hypothetical protein